MSYYLRPFFLFILCWCIGGFVARAQVYQGIVMNEYSHLPIPQVSVVLLDKANNPITYTKTDSSGIFQISIPADKHADMMVFTSLGYEKKTIPTNSYKEGQHVLLRESVTELREVEVKPNVIRQKKDTLIYTVASFQDKQDRSIADVIAKMPGLQVGEDGSIHFQGKPIYKFYIEGMDLMGSHYSMASENLDANKVSEVQVLRNHQHKKTLKDIELSEKTALNIVLKDNAKNEWIGMVDAGIGSRLDKDEKGIIHDARITEMNFAKKMQSLSAYKTNNTGRDIQHEVSDLTRSSRQSYGDGNWLKDVSINTYNINKERSNFNDTHLLATNLLLHPVEDKELRIQLNYLYDNTTCHYQRNRTYTVIKNNPTVEETTAASLYRNELKSDIQYVVNNDKVYASNNLRGFMGFNHSGATTVMNGRETQQYVKPHQLFFGDDLEITCNISSKYSLTNKVNVGYGYYPGELLLTNGNWQDLNTNKINAGWQTSFRHRLFGLFINYEAGIDYEKENLDVTITENKQHDSYQHLNVHVSPTIQFRRKTFEMGASLPLSRIYQRKEQERNSFFLLMPRINIAQHLSSTTKMTIAYNRSWEILPFNNITSIPYYNNYTNIHIGNGTLDRYSIHTATGRIEYSNPSNGLFIYNYINYSLLENVPVYGGNLDQVVYTQKNVGMYSDNNSWMVGGRFSQAYLLAKIVLSAEWHLSWNYYKRLIDDAISKCSIHKTSAIVTLSFRPNNLLYFEEKNYWNLDNQHVNALDGAAHKVNTFSHSLKSCFNPGKWQMEWVNEIRYSKGGNSSFNYFSDLSLSYRTRMWEMRFLLNNIFGSDIFRQNIIDLSYSSMNELQLRPREFLFIFSHSI